MPSEHWLTYTDKKEWQALLHRFPEEKQDVYFQPDYVRLYAQDDDEACCFVYIKGESFFLYPFLFSAVPFLENYFDISTPYGYGGPIATTTDNAFLAEALNAFYGHAKRQNVIAELIKFHPLLDNASLFSFLFPGEIFDVCPTAYVDIVHDKEHLWDTVYTHANRKNINKAIRNNFSVSFSQSPDVWQAFKKLYATTMSANDASEAYLFPDSYYSRIQQYLHNNYILASCQQEDGTIAAVLILLLGIRFAHCHLLGTDRAAMKHGINNLLHHETINWCAQKGFSHLHIGGGRGNTEEDPLFKFKKNFTDKQGVMRVGEHILDPDQYHKACDRWQTANPGRPMVDRLLKYRL